MGKLTSIYLTDEEAEELKQFYEENGCSQYKAIKTGLKELFSNHKEQAEDNEKTEERN